MTFRKLLFWRKPKITGWSEALTIPKGKYNVKVSFNTKDNSHSIIVTPKGKS